MLYYDSGDREFHEPGFDILSAHFLCGFVVSANLISICLSGDFAGENVSLRKSSQFSTRLPQQLRGHISKAWIANITNWRLRAGMEGAIGLRRRADHIVVDIYIYIYMYVCMYVCILDII